MSAGPFLSLEDHFVSSVCQQNEVSKTLALHQFPPAILQQVTDVDSRRIAAMDEGNVRLQVISHIPMPLRLRNCQETNDELYKAVKQHTPRFAAFATLPVADPSQISAELERCVTELGFVGALIPNHAHGIYYDGAEYLELWKTAERLDVPIYLHPCPPSSQAIPAFRGNYSEDVAFALSTHAWDWHANCGLHFTRLYAAGVFDQCPNLKVVLGHLGEMLPFMLGRIERKLALTEDAKSWRRSFREVYARNVWITTSGMFDVESFKCALATTRIDRIMFSVDYPFESTILSVQFMEELRSAQLMSTEDFVRVAYKNGEELLKVKVVL